MKSNLKFTSCGLKSFSIFLIFGSVMSFVLAADFPSKPIRLVIPFPPGGGADAVARVVALKLSENLGQVIIVDNKAGAGGSIATDFVSKSEADGYTLLFTTSGHSIQPQLQKVNWDPIKDFSPISLVVTTPLVVAVNPNLPVNSIPELIKLLKEQPGKYSYGSSGLGGPLNLAVEYFKNLANVDIVHVPYSGNGPMTLALLRGDIQLVFDSLNGPLPNIKIGKMRAIGVTSLKRNLILPETPSLDESGVKGYEFLLWDGILGPAGIPKEITQKLNTQLIRAVQTPSVKESLNNLGYTATGNSINEFSELIKSDYEKYGQIIKQLKISVN
jgi:tripartite-type tricarboxylate transporter receptor subunit TctC